MKNALEISEFEMLAEVMDEAPVDPLAHKIGMYTLAALTGRYQRIISGADVYRQRLENGRKIWETSPAYLLLKEPREHESHWFTLVTSRHRRRPAQPGCIAELIYDNHYADPLAHIRTPSESNQGIVVVNSVANNKSDLEQVWPIIEELNTSRFVCEFEILRFPHISELPSE